MGVTAMLLWWGMRSENRQVGTASHRHCGECGRDSWFTRYVSYRRGHIYGLFRWVARRQLFTVCGTCGARFVDGGDVKASEVTAAIPAFDRRGWLVAPALLVSIMVLGAVF